MLAIFPFFLRKIKKKSPFQNYRNLIYWTFFSISDTHQSTSYNQLDLQHKDATHLPADTTNASEWQMQSSRIQSMVVQDDGSIILCDNEAEHPQSRIDVVKIVSHPNYICGKITKFRNKIF